MTNKKRQTKPSTAAKLDQCRAIAALRKWWNNGNPKTQVFVLHGYAGTGKTWLAVNEIRKIVGGPVLMVPVRFMAFTGKAASVIRAKQKVAKQFPNASTIHGAIKRPIKEEGKSKGRRQPRFADADGGVSGAKGWSSTRRAWSAKSSARTF